MAAGLKGGSTDSELLLWADEQLLATLMPPGRTHTSGQSQLESVLFLKKQPPYRKAPERH